KILDTCSAFPQLVWCYIVQFKDVGNKYILRLRRFLFPLTRSVMLKSLGVDDKLHRMCFRISFS
ncbi:hypothetical protein NDU88_008125, partial [Pleurodeles waltl]